ncbi:transcriptional activator RfaH [Lentisphaera marina]|uniref:transcriptional activator RfaH n=1 Tax=Lentisphaera marina TaxID=1111041 RepID=UPI002366A967|nr:transcriptional activator RfaH [Lentisphaera marina]MDD7987026.1 transcriptional activator RfaH [Lentisphaera marina]
MFEGDWYCLYTKPRQENLAAQSAIDAGFVTFNPKIEKRRLLRGKATYAHYPLFPSYIFVEANDESLDKARYLRGVNRIIGFGKNGTSYKIPAIILKTLSTFLEDNVYKHDMHDLKQGDKVTVLDGPLKGVEAVFQEGLKDGERAIVLFELFSNYQEAKVSLEDIIKSDD